MEMGHESAIHDDMEENEGEEKESVHVFLDAHPLHCMYIKKNHIIKKHVAI